MAMWMDLCKKYRIDFEKQADQPAWLRGVIGVPVARYIMLRCYNYLISNKTITPMEQLPVDEKNNIWETAKDIANGKLTKNELIDFCRCLYAFEYILNL
jgi:hypothetical protein